MAGRFCWMHQTSANDNECRGTQQTFVKVNLSVAISGWSFHHKFVMISLTTTSWTRTAQRTMLTFNMFGSLLENDFWQMKHNFWILLMTSLIWSARPLADKVAKSRHQINITLIKQTSLFGGWLVAGRFAWVSGISAANIASPWFRFFLAIISFSKLWSLTLCLYKTTGHLNHMLV